MQHCCPLVFNSLLNFLGKACHPVYVYVSGSSWHCQMQTSALLLPQIVFNSYCTQLSNCTPKTCGAHAPLSWLHHQSIAGYSFVAVVVVHHALAFFQLGKSTLVQLMPLQPKQPAIECFFLPYAECWSQEILSCSHQLQKSNLAALKPFHFLYLYQSDCVSHHSVGQHSQPSTV